LLGEDGLQGVQQNSEQMNGRIRLVGKEEQKSSSNYGGSGRMDACAMVTHEQSTYNLMTNKNSCHNAPNPPSRTGGDGHSQSTQSWNLSQILNGMQEDCQHVNSRPPQVQDL